MQFANRFIVFSPRWFAFRKPRSFTEPQFEARRASVQPNSKRPLAAIQLPETRMAMWANRDCRGNKDAATIA